MKKVSHLARLKHTLNQIQSLTKAHFFELNGREASSKSVNYETYKKSAIKSEFIRVYTPTLDPHNTNTFAITIDNDMLSMSTKIIDSTGSDVIKGTIPMEFDAFRDLLKSFLKDLTVSPQDWLTLLNQHFITPELNDAPYRAAKREAYREEQKQLCAEYEAVEAELKKQNAITSELKATFRSKVDASPQLKAVNTLKAQLKIANAELLKNNMQITKDLNLDHEVQEDLNLTRKLEALDDKINWTLDM